MIDCSNTSLDWQKHKGDILVLPVGAMEQHGPVLPLNSDVVFAEYAAKQIVEHFDAALLPSLTIASSLEHAAFKGSFSFHPETLMLIVRDLAEEAERQDFKFFIIVNGHGGNFALGPVCRDINRQNRGLKIILHQPYELFDCSQLETHKNKLADIHAGESETSIMMYLKDKDYSLIKGELSPGLSQGDLNTVGVKHLNSEGVLGYPEFATKEKGEFLLKSMTKRMLQYLSERIEYLRKNNDY